MAFNRFRKLRVYLLLRKIFRPQTGDCPTDLSKRASEKETPSSNQHSETNPTSAFQPTSRGSTTPSLVKTPLPVANISDSTVVRSSVRSESEKIKISLWDRAYDSLKEKDKQLVEYYEELLSTELQINDSQECTSIASCSSANKSPVETKNQIEADPKIRLAQLKTITNSGLQRLDEKKSRCFIFGHEFILRDQLAQATQFIQNIRGVIDDAVKASPQASLAWAGICVVLPVLMNPSVAEDASRDGCIYVTSRIQFYVKLESLLSSSGRIQVSGLDIELEERLITLYRSIIDFQIRTVRRVYLTRLTRLTEDIIQHEDWKGMMAKIQQLEKTFNDDFKQVNNALLGRELEVLNNKAEKFLTDINSKLMALLKDGQKASSFYFQNKGTGSQFNSTGGAQNIITDRAIHFSGVQFGASVNFNKT
ncbi:hypothetical protein J3E69DRAFT_348833 [Trichoderma sp. SZMC 28015]